MREPHTGRGPDRPWSATVRLDEIPDTGKHVELEASADTRAALAAPVGVNAIDRLVAHFDLTRSGRDAVHAKGTVSATVRQTCVVTLEPVTNEIEEEIDVHFAPKDEAVAAEPLDPDDEGAEASSPEEPEPLIGSAIDLGVLATEFLILGVDPYPRKEGASFKPAAKDDAAAHPFAALAGLNKKSTVKE